MLSSHGAPSYCPTTITTVTAASIDLSPPWPLPAHPLQLRCSNSPKPFRGCRRMRQRCSPPLSPSTHHHSHYWPPPYCSHCLQASPPLLSTSGYRLKRSRSCHTLLHCLRPCLVLRLNGRCHSVMPCLALRASLLPSPCLYHSAPMPHLALRASPVTSVLRSPSRTNF